MAVNFSPIFNSQVVDSTGAPASGWKVYSYVAGSSTPLATFTDSGGGTSQSNPVVLNSLGFPTTGQIWLTAGSSYKLVLTDASDAVQKTEDNIEGVNDTDFVTADQWIASGLTPTYISATSFSFAGDQTSLYHVGRRLKTTNTGGTIYSTIKSSAFGSITTIVVVNDSGTLDSGLSAVNYGLLSATNPSTPLLTDAYPIVSGSSDKTKRVRMEVDGLTTDTTRVITVADQDFAIGKIMTIQTFTTPGANPWTKPSGCIGVLVKVQAPGGGGGGADSDGTGVGGAGGGGAGGYSEKIILGSALGTTETVTIGAAGTAGSATNGTTGGTGGTTSFGAHCSATGGVGGVGTGVATANAAGAGGAGGAGSTGTINSNGGSGNGGWGVAAQVPAVGGDGGSSVFGSGSQGAIILTGGTSNPGIAGVNYGGGGGGAACASTVNGAAGGTGGPGIIWVYEFY